MNWSFFFSDLQKWMKQANQVIQRHPITTDQYWEWLFKSIGQLSNKYNNHPLVVEILSAVIGYQDKTCKQLIR